MASIYGIQRNKPKVAVVRSIGQPTTKIGEQIYLNEDLNSTLKKFNEFWDLMDTIKKHGYLRAAMSVVGRSAVGAWWTLRKHDEYGKSAPERHRKRLFNFYMYLDKEWKNIKDFQNLAYKIMIATMYLRYFGQAAFYIVRDKDGAPLGLDFLHGLVIPNVDSQGNFKSPAFVQYTTRNPNVREEFKDPRDIVYLINPDWEGSPLGGSDIEALTNFTLPIDIYLQTAAREYLKNLDRPEVVYSLASDISDEGFNAFVNWLQTRHSGPQNLGRSQVAVQGEFDVHELRAYPEKLPYQDSRKAAREEALAVAGVTGAKLGIAESMATANLRELRREFHETSLMPLFTMVEIGLYEQIHVREFGFRGWEFKFNNPDFLTAVERATVHMRYHDMGAMNPNEVRADLNMPARTDEMGDKYIDEKPEKQSEQDPEMPDSDKPGSPPEGREPEPDDPSRIGEPNDNASDPVRGDQHDETRSDRVLQEMRTWREFAVRRMKRGKRLREFSTDHIPQDLKELLQQYIDQAQTPGELVQMFDEAMTQFEEA